MPDDDHIYHNIDGNTASDVTPSRQRQSRRCVNVTVVMATLALCVAVGGCAALFFRLQQQQAEVDLLRSSMKAENLKVRIELVIRD